MDIIYTFFERRALNAYVVGDYAKAERGFAAMLRRGGMRLGVRHNLALARLALKDYVGAEKCFLGELEDYGESFSRLRALADLYYAWGKSDQAEQYYTEALKIYQKDNAPSKAPIEEKRFAELRLALCRDSVAFQLSREAELALDQGNALLQEKRWDEAYVSFERAIKLDASCFPALNNLGVIAMNQRKDYPDAIKRFKAAAKLSSAPALRMNLAKAEALLSSP
ncbi:hypothetical protein MASR2M78_34450 [Treponema sp.]